jgi:hypothetical protein
MLIIPVTDDETLYRRVPCIEGLYVIQADGSVKVSSAAFSDRSFRPSVDRAELCHNDPRKTQREPQDGVVSVVTRDVRSIDTVVQNDTDGKLIQAFRIDVEHVPILNHPTLPDNAAHSEIYMNPACPNKSVFRKLLERLAQLANERPWEIELQQLL